MKRSNDIVNAAEEVIFKNGIQHTSMADIAKEAKLGKSTLYNYFESKGEILLLINQRAHSILARMFEEAIHQNILGIDQTRAIGEAYFSFVTKYPNYFRFISLFEFNEIGVNPEELLVTVKGPGDLLIQAIQKGIEDGSMRNDLDPNYLSKALWSMSTGIAQMIDLKGEVFSEHLGVSCDQLRQTFFDIVNNGIRNPEHLSAS